MLIPCIQHHVSPFVCSHIIGEYMYIFLRYHHVSLTFNIYLIFSGKFKKTFWTALKSWYQLKSKRLFCNLLHLALTDKYFLSRVFIFSFFMLNQSIKSRMVNANSCNVSTTKEDPFKRFKLINYKNLLHRVL